jgi:methionyl-tRNA formyltransferase
VADAAENLGMGVLTPTRLRDQDTLSEIADLGADLIVLADYGRIVPEAMLDLPKHGALNLHPSLLPRYRGATPVPATILAGDEMTGVTLMRMDAGLDTGPIIAQAEQPLAGDERAPELEERLAQVGAELLTASLLGWLDGSLQAQAQPNEGVSLTKPLRRRDGLLDASAAAEVLERQVRAYQPWPGSFIDEAGGRLIVWSATAAAGEDSAEVGGLRFDGELPALVTSSGSLLLDEVQPAGKRRMPGADYLRGRRT